MQRAILFDTAVGTMGGGTDRLDARMAAAGHGAPTVAVRSSQADGARAGEPRSVGRFTTARNAA